MKTSNVLLLSLLAFLLLSTIGVDLSLKSEFNSIDFKDPFRGYTRQALEPFKNVKLEGQSFGVVEIRPGSKFEMRRKENDGLGQPLYVELKMRGDTMVLSQRMNKGDRPIPSKLEDYYTQTPHVYLIAPTAPSVSTEGIIVKISHWSSGAFSATQVGKGILLSDNRFDHLTVTASRGAIVSIDDKNQIRTAEVTVQDSSKLAVKKDVFESFKMQVGDSARVDLPAGLLRKSVDL